MSTLAITISPKVLDWVINYIELSNISVGSLAIVKKWKSGEKAPTFNQVRDLSAKINIPFGYFFLPEPPVEKYPLVDFRTVDSTQLVNPSRNLLDTIDMMTEAQDWMVAYVRDNDIAPLSYVGVYDENTNKNQIADLIREILGISKSWAQQYRDVSSAYRGIRMRISNAGTIVMMNGVVGSNTHRKLNIDEFRAFTMINEYVPLIFINSLDSETGKLFSILHEFAHIIIGKDNLYNSPIFDGRNCSKVETICNAVAAEILVPDDLFLEQWNDSVLSEDDKIATIAKHFRCSRFVIVRKALDNGVVARSTYDRIVSAINEQLRQINAASERSGGGDYYRNKCSQLDRNLVFALNASIREGKTQFTEAFRITKTNSKTFAKVLAEFGGSW